jgi:hypothetical protein
MEIELKEVFFVGEFNTKPIKEKPDANFASGQSQLSELY